MNKLMTSIKHVLEKLEIYHDNYTQKHEECTGKLMKHLAVAMGIDKKKCEELGIVGTLHDLGKLMIPASILEKPTKLSAYEREVIELHPHEWDMVCCKNALYLTLSYPLPPKKDFH